MPTRTQKLDPIQLYRLRNSRVKRGLLVCGRYHITNLAGGKVWILDTDSGEGMATSESNLACHIAEFWRREF